ncbi:MAG: metal/formaldehyde-sensitive transcriptional repressor [Cyanobacteria bacterium REEB67]|nr:metal/formaldehyde-sensitive transcriptional repressor [Cyanobacteria bacterium REEB67]
MAHTTKDKRKLIDRVRRIRGQIDAIEKALDEEKDCSSILHHIAGCRGAMNGLMAEVVEGHIRSHILTNGDGPDDKQAQAQAAEDLIDLVKSYLK